MKIYKSLIIICISLLIFLFIRITYESYDKQEEYNYTCVEKNMDGFDCVIPDKNTIYNKDNDTRKTSSVCQKYNDANMSDDRIVSYQDIARAWKAAGNNMDYCPHALIIAGGECQTTANEQGCSIKGTGPSGIWQVDSSRGSDYNLYNPCDNARAVSDNIVSTNKSNAGCMFLNQEDKIAPLRISDNGSSTVLYTDTSNPKGNCNWLGPFCHLHLPSGWSDNVSCCAWTGGGNSYQPQGFPYYYMYRFMKNIDDNTPDNCSKGNSQNCIDLATKSIKKATEICNSI